jgi:predicted NAD/FAD-binding protein
MSFSVADARTGIEWRGSSASSVFAQRRNLVRRDFLAMLVDIGRFNRLASGWLQEPPGDEVTLEEALSSHHFSAGFRDWYLVPLGSSIWSAGPRSFTQIPAVTFARFFERHGLLRLRNQPHWRTIEGGSRSYVEAILGPLRNEGRLRLNSPVEKIRREPGGVELLGPWGIEHFDHVVLATHSDQALGVLSDPDRAEREILGAIRYQYNSTTLHTDARLLPRNRRAWASWNYHRLLADSDRATLTYDLNRLQGLETTSPVLVTLNRDDAIDPSLVLAHMDYSHPVFDPAAVAAQQRHVEINGARRTWFCGAYWGYGFHEDGVASAVRTCRELGASL